MVGWVGVEKLMLTQHSNKLELLMELKLSLAIEANMYNRTLVGQKGPLVNIYYLI